MMGEILVLLDVAIGFWVKLLALRCNCEVRAMAQDYSLGQFSKEPMKLTLPCRFMLLHSALAESTLAVTLVVGLVIGSVVALAGCGGSGSATTAVAFDANNTSSDNDNIPVTPQIRQIKSTVPANQATELILHAPNQNISNILWRKTSGPDATFYAATSKVIGFTPTAPGRYQFEVQYVLNDATTETLTRSFSVTDSGGQLSVRLGHAAVEGIPVSLTGFLPPEYQFTDADTSSWRWSQTAGPTVEFLAQPTSGADNVYFIAPQVAQDTILEFKLSGELAGQTVTDDVAILVVDSDIGISNTNSAFSERVAEVFLYNPDSAAGQQLVDCVYSNKAVLNECTFERTPLIGQQTFSPSVDDIMDRVIVSHQWMGDNFKAYLQNHDEYNDFKSLLRAVSAVVIAYDVRPSFYNPNTAAIHLDPYYLWLTAEQRDTINQQPDYRSNFGQQLQFEVPWRWVKDNSYAYFYYPPKYRLDRTLTDTKYELASLLYHELAHANDFFPSSIWPSLRNNETVNEVFLRRYYANQTESDFLQDVYPLDDLYLSGGQNELTKLAYVRFFNPDAIEDYQTDYTPTDFTEMFRTQSAPDFYSYATIYEDLALLFDSFMMQARYNVERDVTVSNADISDIVWGQRGRIGEQAIRDRAAVILSTTFPDFTAAAQALDDLPAPVALDDSKSWTESVIVEALTASGADAKAAKGKEPTRWRIPKDGETPHQLYRYEAFAEQSKPPER